MSNNLLQVRDLTLTVPHKVLCDSITFSIETSQKVWLVARNGSGKSTVLKAIAWLVEPQEGVIDILPTVRVWYLAQSDSFDPESVVFDALFAHENILWQTIRKYEEALESGDDQLLADLVVEIDELQWWDYETNIRIVINKLNLDGIRHQKIQQCSWWELKRVALAKLLIDDPDFLVVDEPTNHLDLEMIEWLEHYFKRSRRTLLIVTHDRYFLERLCDTILELDQWRLHSYPWNYTKFLDLKTQREETEILQHHKLKQELKRETERMRKAPRARETKSVKREKEFHALEKQYSMAGQYIERRKKKITFDLSNRRIGGKILEVKQLYKSYWDKKIIEDFSYVFSAGERVGLIGPNGVGKSTFIKMMMGEESPDRWQVNPGDTITMSLFRQKHVPIDETKKVIDIVRDVSEYMMTGSGKQLSASHLLERFMFPPQQQHQRAHTLSWGEKRRLHLLTILIQNPNFLILDEPTNDLDIETLNILEEFLLGYKWSLMIVSHDRFFMDTVVDHLLVFEGDGVVREFPGNYSEWKAVNEGKMDIAELEKKQSSNTDWSKKAEIESSNDYSVDPQSKKQVSQKRRSLSNKEREELKKVEQRIEVLELRKKELHSEMTEHATNHEKMSQLWIELSAVTSELWDIEERWLELNE